MAEANSIAVPAKTAKAAKVAKKSAKVKAPSKAWAEKYRPNTIGRQIADLIVAGKLDNTQILEQVKKTHKGAKTTYGCVAWYRSKAKKS